MTPKKTIITSSREQQQRFLMNCAKIAVATKGRQFEARYDVLSLLLSIKGGSELSENELNLIEEFGNNVSVLVSYYSDIKKRVLNQEDVSSNRFIYYKEALAKCFNFLFKIDQIWIKLSKGTDLENKTIPSHYYLYVKDEETKKPEQLEQEPMEYSGGEAEDSEKPEEDDSDGDKDSMLERK